MDGSPAFHYRLHNCGNRGRAGVGGVAWILSVDLYYFPLFLFITAVMGGDFDGVASQICWVWRSVLRVFVRLRTVLLAWRNRVCFESIWMELVDLLYGRQRSSSGEK